MIPAASLRRPSGSVGRGRWSTGWRGLEPTKGSGARRTVEGGPSFSSFCTDVIMPPPPVAKRTRNSSSISSSSSSPPQQGVTITTFMKKQRVPLVTAARDKKPASALPQQQPRQQQQQQQPGPNWEAAAEKAINSKFRPRPGIPKKGPVVPVVEGHVPKGASILIIQQPWIDLILDGIKSLEVRGNLCKKQAGERVYLACSGLGGYLLGSVTFVKCHGPFSRAEWGAKGMQHCVGGDSPPYGGGTFGWEFSKPQRFREPVPYLQKQG